MLCQRRRFRSLFWLEYLGARARLKETKDCASPSVPLPLRPLRNLCVVCAKSFFAARRVHAEPRPCRHICLRLSAVMYQPRPRQVGQAAMAFASRRRAVSFTVARSSASAGVAAR